MFLGRFFLGLLLILGLAGSLAAAPGKLTSEKPAKSKRKTPVPTVKDVENAFRVKTDQPRANLFIKLQRVTEEADVPEIVAAIERGLWQQLDKQALGTGDLRLLSWLGQCQRPEAIAALQSFLPSDDVRVVIVALRALTDSGRAPPWDQTLLLTARKDYSKVFALRRGVVTAAEMTATKEAVDFLIETVSEAEGQIKYEAARSLAAVTGQSFGGQGAKWAAWWRTARENFVAVPSQERTSSSLQQAMPWDGPVPKFYELPVYARRVLFVIDRSKSMNWMEQGESRIDRARRELEQAIEALPPTTEFDILAFHDSVTSFTPKLVPASYSFKQHAVLFVRNLIADKATNCYDALSLALDADPNLEAVYFLSDGAPTTGGIVDPAIIVDAVSTQNQLRLTSIYTLGIDARGVHEEFLKQLAVRNYGEFFSIR